VRSPCKPGLISRFHTAQEPGLDVRENVKMTVSANHSSCPFGYFSVHQPRLPQICAVSEYYTIYGSKNKLVYYCDPTHLYIMTQLWNRPFGAFSSRFLPFFSGLWGLTHMHCLKTRIDLGNHSRLKCDGHTHFQRPNSRKRLLKQHLKTPLGMSTYFRNFRNLKMIKIKIHQINTEEN